MKNESKTLLIPLFGKAMMSREGLFPDPWAERIVEAETLDFSPVDRSRKLAVMMAMRAALFDEHAGSFLNQHPDSLVLQLGVGLDSRVRRVNMNVPWYDLDFPDVAEIRREYYPESDSYHIIGAPAVPTDYLSHLPDTPWALVMAEGLSMYLSEEEMLTLMQAFQAKWPHTLFLFDAYTSLAARLSPLKNPINAVKAKISFALDDPQQLAARLPGASCVLNSGLITQAGMSRLTGVDRLRFRMMRRPAEGLYRLYGLQINKM